MELGYSLTTGQELWAHNLTIDQYTAARAFGEGVYAGFNPDKMVWFGYDVNSGTQLWTSDPADYPWGSYGLSGIIVYGKLYALSYDGSVHAFDIKTGKQVFKYYSGNDTYRETPYGTFPFYYGPMIADGVVFAGNGEHSPSLPLYRGYKLHAFNASTGTPVWNISGWMAIQAIADGYLVTSNAEDNLIYVFGKGPSKTTVTAPDTAITLGSSIVIRGTVTDQSTGAKDTPAISDESMSAWMEYLYMQQPFPTNATGVTVTLDVVDANGNYRSIGTATSDTSGAFSYMWEPDIPGKYTLIATFMGSESYYASYAETAFGVTEAPPATPTPTPLVLPPYETYTIGAAVAVIIAIAIVGILILRKK
jgi:outer membrane protein assembly factor BamB